MSIIKGKYDMITWLIKKNKKILRTLCENLILEDDYIDDFYRNYSKYIKYYKKKLY